MKIGKPFNQCTFREYKHYIVQHKKYTDFNTLGLYRSLGEENKLTLAEAIEVREYAHTFFHKTFEFLQLKDPGTYFKVATLGLELTQGDWWQWWEQIRANQQAILAQKQIKHRNFGTYSKHECGFDDCPYQGVMFQQGNWWLDGHMQFPSDKNEHETKQKAQRIRKARKQQHRIIRQYLDEEK